MRPQTASRQSVIFMTFIIRPGLATSQVLDAIQTVVYRPPSRRASKEVSGNQQGK